MDRLKMCMDICYFYEGRKIVHSMEKSLEIIECTMQFVYWRWHKYSIERSLAPYPVLTTTEIAWISEVCRASSLHKLFMDLTDTSERKWEILKSPYPIIQCVDIVEDILDIAREITLYISRCLYRIDDSRTSPLYLAGVCRIEPDIHRDKKIHIRKKLCDTIELTDQSRCLCIESDNLRTQDKNSLRRKWIWDEGREST